MIRLIDDPEEARVVLEQLIRKSSLEELTGPLTPSDRCIEDLLLLDEGEEVEVELIGREDIVVAVLIVDVQTDPVNRWRLGLRGWRLADDTASL